MVRRAKDATIDDLVNDVRRLARYVEQLDSGIRLLAGRIVPFDDEEPPFDRGIHVYFGNLPKEPTLNDIHKTVHSIDKHIENCERDFGSLRSTFNQLMEGNYLSDDLRQWVDRGNRKKQ